MSAARLPAQAPATADQGFLLDTSVISALAPGREKHLPADVAAWLHVHDSQFFVPSIAVTELAQGIAKLHRSGGTERAGRLDIWLDRLIAGFGDRILPLDPPTARLAGQISDAAVAIGRHPGFADVAIAAMARQNSLLLLTRNLKHFQPLGVACADPFKKLPLRVPSP